MVKLAEMDQNLDSCVAAPMCGCSHSTHAYPMINFCWMGFLETFSLISDCSGCWWVYSDSRECPLSKYNVLGGFIYPPRLCEWRNFFSPLASLMSSIRLTWTLLYPVTCNQFTKLGEHSPLYVNSLCSFTTWTPVYIKELSKDNSAFVGTSIYQMVCVNPTHPSLPQGSITHLLEYSCLLKGQLCLHPKTFSFRFGISGGL